MGGCQRRLAWRLVLNCSRAHAQAGCEGCTLGLGMENLVPRMMCFLRTPYCSAPSGADDDLHLLQRRIAALATEEPPCLLQWSQCCQNGIPTADQMQRETKVKQSRVHPC